jgi:hypothetical protein
MKMRSGAAVLFFFLSLVCAQADSLVVQTCGTLPLAYAPGATRNDTIDVNGNKCVDVVIGGGSSTSNQGTPNTAANAWPFYLALGGTAISATNGIYTNLLQGNAVLSQTNPIFNSITDGTNKAVVKAASTAPATTDPALVVGISPNGINPNGSATSANSAPVVIASDQAAVTVKGAGPAAPASSLATVSAGYTYTHIATSTTTAAIKTGAGVLHTVCINTLGTVASTITVDDALTATTPTIAIINSLNLLGCQTYDVTFSTGLTVVTTGTVAPDVTVLWR